MLRKKACLELVKELHKINTKEQLDKLKIKISKKYKFKRNFTNIEILSYLPGKNPLLTTKPSRTKSGVTVIAVMSKSSKCPKQAKCIYCPGGMGSFFGDTPKSYIGKAPATLRAIRNKYDPYLQIFNRLEQYVLLNQDVSKVELIVMGGTFLAFDKEYKEEFIMYCFKALNDFSDLFFKNGNLDFIKFKNFFELPGDVNDDERLKKIHVKALKVKGSSSLKKEQLKNETSNLRCVGLTIETRPDFGKLKEGNELLRYGCTRVELGIQTVYEDILEKIKRGHTLKDSIESIKVLKDLGFKINLHYMPGLFVDLKKDLRGLKELFLNSDFRPDMLKIYPCRVFEGTELFNMYKKGEYKPLTNKELVNLLFEFKKFVPEYCRIMRINRDIPTSDSLEGIKTNLRQYIGKLMEEQREKCKCIRCREVKNNKVDNLKLIVRKYLASKGKEFFISLEDVKKDLLVGFCRLRFPSTFLRKEITKDTAIIRELHVYSDAIKIGMKSSTDQIQHRGFGKLLMKKAEEISIENGKKKILVISGVGVKKYYIDKLGYKKEGVYVSKEP